MRRTMQAAVCAAAISLTGSIDGEALAQARPTAVAATRASDADLRSWDRQIDAMVRSRDLRVREVVRDEAVEGRTHERLDQYFKGVRIEGGDLTRQTAADGTVSLFGTIHTDLQIDTAPKLSIDEARAAIGRAAGGNTRDADPELVVLPLSDGYHLAYYGQATTEVEVVNVYVDANSGEPLRQFSAFTHDVIAGKGTYNDDKKVSVTVVAGASTADDKLRPAAITTYDMKGNFSRTTLLFGNAALPAASDIASTSTSPWTDGTVVDAHVYAGLYYDYLFKRFGRHGVDGRDLRIALFTHPVSLSAINTASASVVGTYYINAAFCSTCGPNGRGAVVLGEGAPRGFLGPGIEVKPFSASFDVVAHELTHAVTFATARMNGFPFSEAGSLNEAFSDVFGVSTAFYFEPTGTAPLTASYFEGRDLTVPSGALGRSLSAPSLSGDPDHYTLRNIGGDPHYNGVILGHAFYLAVEGGTNRTSGLAVQGVGAANREQIEKAFFRALTVLLPSSATFALARATTIQASRDLYGAGSAAERAITQAWAAVGVQDRVDPTIALLPNPATGSTTSCGVPLTPNWAVGITVSAGASSLRFGQGQFDFIDGAGATINSSTLASTTIASLLNQCGPASDRLLAQNDACAAVCVGLGGRTSGSLRMTLNAIDDAGRTVTISSTTTLAQPR